MPLMDERQLVDGNYRAGNGGFAGEIGYLGGLGATRYATVSTDTSLRKGTEGLGVDIEKVADFGYRGIPR